ncbi:cytochrome P450 family protein [Ceratobasidium sp. AG-Ba]|nr:cytochrome P450 family protein [Ceratobasidium sp. AG-Ba]
MLALYFILTFLPFAFAQFGGGFFENMFGGGQRHHQQQQQQQQQRQGSMWSQQADAIPCSQYLCPNTLACVSTPVLCPCPAPEDIKCVIPDAEGGSNDGTVVCVRAAIYVATIALRNWRRAWERRDLASLPGPTRQKWSKGHVPALYSPDTAFEFHDSLSEYGPVAKLYGVFGSIRLYINDPYAMGEVLLKEQNGFERTESYVSNLNAVLGPGLLGSRGMELLQSASEGASLGLTAAPRRTQTQSPTQDPSICVQFNCIASNGMKTWLYAHDHHGSLILILLCTVADIPRCVALKLIMGIEDEIRYQGVQVADVDVFKWGYRCALDSVGRAGLGHDFQALDGVDSDYSKAIKHLLPALFSLVILRPIMPTLYKIGPAWFRRAIIERVPSKAVKQLLSIVDVQHRQAIQIFKQKKAALRNSEEKGSAPDEKDIITLMLRANEKARPEDKISEEEMVGQINTLIFAGHDTTSGTIACVLQMLAENPKVQAELREELTHCSTDEPDYATLEAFPLLDAVIKETLRLHPPAAIAERVSTRDTVLPLRSPTRGTYPTTSLAVPAGTLVMLSLRTANRDPATWGPDALEWNPYRWLEPLPANVVEARVPGVYSNIMSFLGGSCSCIAYKFALIEAKVVISSLVRRFQFSPGDRPVMWKFGGTSKPFVVDPASGASSPGLVLKLGVV